ncbi:MAG TPA: peptide ABC transporter substrate-binding protein [Pseudomonadaceae bacterium]|nr:peptide ABC transporter substrate-binding protein [Pseudomonadaceae bacterium]
MKALIVTPRKVLALFLLLSLVACGGDGANRVEEGDRLGVLHIGNAAEPAALDPHITTGVSESHIINALFEGLVIKNPATLEPEPAVAERWEVSEDGRTYTFHLREDALWSNGEPLTAEDFRWSWMRALMPELGSQYNYMFFSIVNAQEFAEGRLDDFSQVGVEVLGPHTLQVRLREATPYFLQLLDHHSTYPVNRGSVEALGSASDRLSRWARVGNLVGNGPFTLVEWRTNSHIRVEKNPLYWDAETTQLNAIVFYAIDNQATEERMFRDGQLHHTYDVPLDKVPVYLAENPELIRIEPYLGTYFYGINTSRPGLDDARVRRALALSVDRELLAETVTQGIYRPGYSVVPPDTMGYNPPQLFEYDPDEARRLLAEAGYPNGAGFPSFSILYNTLEQHQKIAVAIQQMWSQELGISVQLVNQEWQVYLDSQNTRNFDMVRRGWIGDYVDPNNFLDLFISGGGNNHTGFSNARYDEIILEQAPATLDRDERYALFHEAERLLMAEMPLIPLYVYQSKHLVRPSLKGMPSNIMDFYNWKYVYLEPQTSQP